jgi:hypothetical protein
MAFYAATEAMLWKFPRRDFRLGVEEPRPSSSKLVSRLARGREEL